MPVFNPGILRDYHKWRRLIPDQWKPRDEGINLAARSFGDRHNGINKRTNQLMKRNLSSVILRPGLRLLAGCLLAMGIHLPAQNTIVMAASGGSGGGVALAINGVDIGAILLKACDLNQDGKVTLTELKTVAAACFKQWDTNNDGNLSVDELYTGLKNLFPAPRVGGQAQAMAMVNGVAVPVSPDDMPTPDKQITKHLMILADGSKDGLLSLQELDDWLDKSFGQWDQNGDGALDVSELDAAFGQLARPD